MGSNPIGDAIFLDTLSNSSLFIKKRGIQFLSRTGGICCRQAGSKAKKTHGFSRNRECVLKKVAARPGLEPRLNEPESLVLPLHQRAVNE